MHKMHTKVPLILIILGVFGSSSQKLPGHQVFVVTPAPRSVQIDEGRSAPFYYHNWMRREDSPQDVTSKSTTEKVKTPDLIFADFESNNMKSIRKLLEKERIQQKTTTTTESPSVQNNDIKESLYSKQYEDMKIAQENNIKYMTSSHNYNKNPIYPSSITTSPTTTTTIASESSSVGVENIWNIIDSEKYNQYSGKWDEVPLEDNSNIAQSSSALNNLNPSNNTDSAKISIPQDFALPGFGGNGGENESRAIRTESKMRFPYVNLKPFQLKPSNMPGMKPLTNSKNSNNLYTNLDEYKELRNPVRGEALDGSLMPQNPIDRYNPAQPYLPPAIYGSKSKQSIPSNTPIKTVANLIPPPPPPVPNITDNDFPSPINYDSFPPYPSSGPIAPAPVNFKSPAVMRPPPVLAPPIIDNTDSLNVPSDTDDGPNDNNVPMGMGYNYMPPKAQYPQFVPTVSPPSKPFPGFSYNKPSMNEDMPPDTGYGYSYDKPEPPYASQDHDSPPDNDDSLPHFDHHHHDSFHHDDEYPELIFKKPSAGKGQNGDTMMKGMANDDMGMSPPPPPPNVDMNPSMDMDPNGSPDDSGFPADFPGNLKYHNSYDDHDFDHYHHHHHPTTTTTTTTEMPRVNRYSYYYLGKKLYYLPLYFSVYFIIYVGALIIKAVLRHKIVYPNSWRPNDQTSSFFSKRSVDSLDLSHERLHEITGRVTKAIATAANKYLVDKSKSQ